MEQHKLILTSPPMRGKRARNAQWLLCHNRFHAKFYTGDLDGEWGLHSGHAADKARWFLGYPKRKVKGGSYGEELHHYLQSTHWKPLPLGYRTRRALRLRAERKRHQNSEKGRALAIALTQVGTVEYPFGSNLQKYGVWYGFNGVAWCAIFVSYCLAHGGWTKARTALAFQWEWWARANEHGLSITYNPEPGDIVVYHFGQGHTGLFKGWVNRAAGHFQAVEGNTSKAGSQDNGGGVCLQDRYTNFGNPTFIRVS